MTEPSAAVPEPASPVLTAPEPLPVRDEVAAPSPTMNTATAVLTPTPEISDAHRVRLALEAEVDRADRRVRDRRQNLVHVEKERDNLRVFVILAVLAPLPATLIKDWKIGVFVCCSFIMFYVAGRYLNFMHVRNARQDLDNAQGELARLSDRLGAG